MVASVTATGNLSLCGSSGSSGSAFLFGSKLDFPITGIWNAQLNSNTTYLQTLAKYNFITYVAWIFQQASSGISAASSMQSVKSYAIAAGNPYCKTLKYNLHNEWFQNTSDTGFFDNARLAMLNSSPYWWLVSNYPGTTRVTSQDGLPRIATNISDTTPIANLASLGSVTGPGNVNCAQALAWLEVQQYILGKSHSLNASDPVYDPNPYLDGFMHDNQETSPYVSGNWLTTATSYTCTSSTYNSTVGPHVGAGYKQTADMVRSMYPTTPGGSSFIVGGNTGGFGFGATAVWPTPMQGLYDLPLMEQPFGGYENFNGLNYNDLIAGLVAAEVTLRPGSNNYVLGLIEAASATGGTQNPFSSSNQASWTAADWRAFRYQAANFLMMRWATVIDISTRSTVWQFDEFFGGSAVNTLQWLGQPIGSRNLTAWLAQGTYGLFKADFTNGSVIINPRANGAQTFNMPYTGHFLANGGFGDPTYNTGAAFTTSTSMTLQDRDAIFIRNT